MTDEATKPEGESPPEQADAPSITGSPHEADFRKLLKQDPRARLYEKSDKMNHPEWFERKDEAGEPPTEPKPPDNVPAEEAAPEGETAETTPEDAPGEAPAEAPTGPRIVTWDEVKEAFGDIRIRDKMAGEDVELPLDEYRRATGRGRDFQRRMDRLKQREREFYERERGAATPDQDVLPQTDQAIREKYDELFAESPFKANQYLASVEEHKRRMAAERAQKDVDDFRDLYPEVTDEIHSIIEQPAFYTKYRDVVEAAQRGDVFSALSRAYTHFQQAQLEKDRAAEKEKREREKREEKAAAEAKRKGTVLRTSTRPEPPKKPEAPKYESGAEYLKRRIEESKARMNIPKPKR